MKTDYSRARTLDDGSSALTFLVDPEDKRRRSKP